MIQFFLQPILLDKELGDLLLELVYILLSLGQFFPKFALLLLGALLGVLQLLLQDPILLDHPIEHCL